MKPRQTALNTDQGTSVRLRAAILALATAGLIALIGPAAAQAIGLDNLSSEPGPAPGGTTQGGANSDFEISMTFTDPGDDVKKLVIGLPPGQIGNPTSPATCSLTDFNADTCPAASQVGSVTTDVTAYPAGLPLGVPLSAPGTLYNIPAHPGEPARFGIVLRPLGGIAGKIFLESGVELRLTDFGLNTIIDGIPDEAPPLAGVIPIPIDVTAMQVTLQGQAGSPAGGFMRNPTSCDEATTSFSATSYTGSTTTTPATGEASYTPTGCDVIPFSPAFSALLGAPGLTAVGSKPPMTTVIEQDADEAGLLRAEVILPETLGADNSMLGTSCPDSDFQAGTCPPSTIIGSAIATSPLLTEPLTGPVALVSNLPLPDVGLDLRGPLAMKLKGNFVFAGGGSGVVFDGLPDIPISRFALSFNGGPGGLLINGGDLCQPPDRVFSTAFDAYSGATQSGVTAATIEGCGAAAGQTGGQAKAKKCKVKKKKHKTAATKTAAESGATAKKKRKKKCGKKKRKKR